MCYENNVLKGTIIALALIFIFILVVIIVNNNNNSKTPNILVAIANPRR